MLFDLRGGHRGKMVKVVYAVLAVLMGSSLFLTVGPVNIGELFGGGGGRSSAAEPYEEQAERIQVRLNKEPANADLLLSLTRAQINAGNAGVTIGSGEQREYSSEAIQAYQEADQTWSEYLKATKEPSASLAQLVAPMMITLAEFSTSYPQAELRIQSAADAQQIVAEDRPTVNSLSTLGFYTYFTGNFPAAEKARAEAKALAKTKAEREEIDKALDEYKKNATFYIAAKSKAEKEQKAAGDSGSPEILENPLSLGGGLGE